MVSFAESFAVTVTAPKDVPAVAEAGAETAKWSSDPTTVRVPVPEKPLPPLSLTVKVVAPSGVAVVVWTVRVTVAGQVLRLLLGVNDPVAPVGNPVTPRVSEGHDPLPLYVIVTVNVTDPAVPALNVPVCAPTLMLITCMLAARYGPTTGPPPGAPTGVTGLVLVSATARARFSRPLPV